MKLPHITLDGFSEMTPNKELYAKGWTRKMIDTLGKPHMINHAGLPSWRRKHVEATIATPAFILQLIKALKDKTPMLYRVITPEVLVAACEALYDLNKYIKARRFTAGTVQRSYRLKFILLQHLLDAGYVTEIARETDTGLYRLTVEIEGRTFVWHQPENQAKRFITTYTETVSTPDVVDAPIVNPNPNAVFNILEQIVISILVAKFQAQIDTSVVR